MENKINISFIVKYLFKIFRLLILGIGITYILACLWYLLVSNIYDPNRPHFYESIDKPGNTNFRKFVICFYFIITTLSTVGYGDYTPKSDIEKICAIIL